MTFPNDDRRTNRPTPSRPTSDRRSTIPTNNNWAGWVVAAVCVIAIVMAAVFYASRNNHTAGNTDTAPQTTTGTNTGNTGSPPK